MSPVVVLPAPRSHPSVLARLAAGDTDAVAELMQTYAPLIRSIARRHGAGPAGADDLVQETMVRLWRAADRFDPGRGNEKAYVAAVARNAAIDMSRRTATRATAVPTPEPDEWQDPVPPAADHVATRVTVGRALATLTDERRELLRLAYFEGLSQAEIALRLEIPVGTVKSRTFQALRLLRSVLRDAA
jgi:RNA polymerase sigma-70 factor (ECF subfamily)